RRSRVAMSGSPHRRQANTRPRSYRMAGPPQQAPRQSRLAIHNRQRPRQAEETVPSVRVTRATSTGTRRHRIVSSPPLPRPRPAQLAKAPMELPAAAVEPNTAHPAATAVVPNNAPAALARTAAEPDKAPAPTVEPQH